MKNQPKRYSYHNYSRYQSASKKKSKKKPPVFKTLALAILVIVVFAVPTYAYVHNNQSAKKSHSVAASPPKKTTTAPTIVKTPVAAAPAVQTETTACTGNTLNQLLVTSISQRHLWACQGSQVVYQTAVVTGDMNVVADVTPVGTYHIYAKYTNLYLNGSDSRGSWHDYVNYWMPFLDNEYGTFGLHDATWRAPTDFGNISPYSDDASHGCIELPLAAANWIFHWSVIGTTVTIES